MGTVGEGNGTPLQYSCLENAMDGGAWWATVHRVEKSGTQLSKFTFTFHDCSPHVRVQSALCMLTELMLTETL